MSRGTESIEGRSLELLLTLRFLSVECGEVIISVKAAFAVFNLAAHSALGCTGRGRAGTEHYKTHVHLKTTKSEYRFFKTSFPLVFLGLSLSYP